MAEQTDLEIVTQNSYIVGMALFSLGVLFNTATFITICVTGLIRQSTGIYILFLVTADTFFYLSGVLIYEFYFDWINVDVFEESGDPVMLCQAIYFFHEMFLYYRWVLLAMLLIDRCLYVAGSQMPRLRICAVVFSFLGMLLCAGLAGYWIYWVGEELIPDGDAYQFGACHFILSPMGVHDTAWFYMEILVHLAFPDVVCLLTILIAAIVLRTQLGGKGGETQDDDDYSLSKALVILAFVNILFMIPYLVVNCILLYIDRVWDTYDFSETMQENLSYAAIIFRQTKAFGFCLTFFVLLHARPFRACCCRN